MLRWGLDLEEHVGRFWKLVIFDFLTWEGIIIVFTLYLFIRSYTYVLHTLSYICLFHVFKKCDSFVYANMEYVSIKTENI